MTNTVEGKWKQMSKILKDAAIKTCGQTRGGKLRAEKETWWWNNEVQNILRDVL